MTLTRTKAIFIVLLTCSCLQFMFSLFVVVRSPIGIVNPLKEVLLQRSYFVDTAFTNFSSDRWLHRGLEVEANSFMYETIEVKESLGSRTERQYSYDTCTINSSYIINHDKNETNSSFGSPRVVKEEHIKYSKFRFRLPKFASNRSQMLFLKYQENKDFLEPINDVKLVGTIYHICNGTYSMPHDCGYLSTVDHVLKTRSIDRKSGHWMACLVPLLIPDGRTFQHFIDGVLPKIMQVLNILRLNPSCKLLLQRLLDSQIMDMLSTLNISESQIVWKSGNNYGADKLIYTCNTPPLHPFLWQKARFSLGAKTELAVPVREAYVLLMTRSGCYNCGRRILNQVAVEEMLQARYGNRTVKVFTGPYNFKETLELFGRARLIMGPHGGSMYNILFAPRRTTVVEFMPTHADGTMAAASKQIIWAQSLLLGQDYWRMALPVVNQSNIVVDLAELKTLLDKVDEKVKYY